MNIKNYTSVVPAMNSMAAIEAHLVEAGATSIMKWYEEKRCVGFLFQLMLNGQPVTFRLPAYEERVAQLMLRQARNPDATKRASIRAQAQRTAWRTAWRTLHELVQIQVAMIQLQQVQPLEAFLSYAYDSKTETTFYDRVETGSVKLLN